MLLKNEIKSSTTYSSSLSMDNNNFDSSENTKFFKIFGILLASITVILLIVFSILSIYNFKHNKILHGVYIKNINVSGLTKEEAKLKITEEVINKMPQNITLIYKDFETTISLEQIQASFDINSAVEKAFEISNPKNLIEKDLTLLKLLNKPINIEPVLNIDENALNNVLNDISTKLPNTISQSGYYIEDNKLIITPGHAGPVVNTIEMAPIIVNSIKDLSYYNTSIEIITKIENPNPIDVDAIHSEIYKEPVNAYYTQNPRALFAHKNGLDFGISVQEVKNIINSGEKEEYSIPLKVLTPAVTTNMIGLEAFPDYLSTFSTRYINNANRTTNLRLAANKINGTVLMPGEIFSYNKVVGKRTIEAGYKNAAIYENGQVVDGLGGGICQISSTLFNAVLFANLEIVERRNHQFIPSYVGAGRDATVVYGSQDFKFKNTRNYPIKITCSVSGGIAKFDIYGLREANEYQVEVASRVTSRTSKAINSLTQRTLKQNGQLIKSEIICRDTYKVH